MTLFVLWTPGVDDEDEDKERSKGLEKEPIYGERKDEKRPGSEISELAVQDRLPCVQQPTYNGDVLIVDPGAPGRHHTARTQEHPDAVTPQGPKSTRTPSHHKDPGTPDTIRLGGPRCNQTILDQENPEVPQTSLDQEIPEAPIIL
ncbi:hypothetical protein STEG23_008581 [Scotinomys teguina]